LLQQEEAREVSKSCWHMALLTLSAAMPKTSPCLLLYYVRFRCGICAVREIGAAQGSLDVQPGGIQSQSDDDLQCRQEGEKEKGRLVA